MAIQAAFDCWRVIFCPSFSLHFPRRPLSPRPSAPPASSPLHAATTPPAPPAAAPQQAQRPKVGATPFFFTSSCAFIYEVMGEGEEVVGAKRYFSTFLQNKHTPALMFTPFVTFRLPAQQAADVA